MPLQAMPNAVPHMELPLYQNENAGMANRPEIANTRIDGSVAAAAIMAGTREISPPMAAKIGNATSSSSSPAVSCLMAMPMR